MKKYTILALVFVLTAAVLAGCRNPNNTTGTTGATTIPTQATTHATTAATTEPATHATTEATTHATTEATHNTEHDTQDTTNGNHTTDASDAVTGDDNGAGEAGRSRSCGRIG